VVQSECSRRRAGQAGEGAAESQLRIRTNAPSLVLPTYRNISPSAQWGKGTLEAQQRARVGADLVAARKARPHPYLPPQAGEGVYLAIAMHKSQTG
jgi:hypothetical protein